MPRRRAKQACLHCRRRKVRCDVAFGGSPCLNCRLDEVECEVKDREPKRSRLNTHTEPTKKPASASARCGEVWLRDDMEPFLANDGDWMGEFGFSPSQPSPSDGSDRQNNAPEGAIPGPKPTDNYLPFTKSPDLDTLPADDVTFLRQQGCFNLPPKEALDEFVREYFLHVHPMLPLMDESAFWDQYSGVEERNTSTLSLLVVQAMLYASSCFVSESVTKGLGFECPRFAAAEFYRRAKLLYDFETESSTVDLARGALLLAFWPGTFGSGHPNPNSVWLTRAIQHAKCLGANKAWSGLEESRKPPDAPDITSLKRLWWCCIIRDRSLSLGLRRYIQIPGRYPPLEDEDFKSELDGSLVYTPDTKAQLFRIFQRLMVFCNIVTDLLQLTSRSRGIPYHPKTTCSDDRTILAQCREDLSAWFSTTGEEFLGLSKPGQLRHQSIIVYTNLAYIHYYTAKMLLYHQQILVDISLFGLTQELPSTLFGIDHEVRSAAIRFIEHIAEPARLGLACYLPVSVACFAAIPITMHVFEAKLSSPARKNDQTTGNQWRLQILIEVLKTYHPRVDGIESLSYLVRQTVNSVEGGLKSQGGNSPRSWTDVIAYRPVQYLSCTAQMNWSLSSSQYPKDCNKPCGWPTQIENRNLTENYSLSSAVTSLEGLESIDSLALLTEQDWTAAHSFNDQIFGSMSVDLSWLPEDFAEHKESDDSANVVEVPDLPLETIF